MPLQISHLEQIVKPGAPGPLREAAGSGSALETITKSSALFREVIDPQTGEVLVFSRAEKRDEFVPYIDSETARKNARNARFALQREAARLLRVVPRKKKEINPSNKLDDVWQFRSRQQDPHNHSAWRVTGCGSKRILDQVHILYSEKLKRAHFGNLMICGSAWTCPVCAAKIAERRRQEISSACNQHVAASGGMAMVTLTFRHSRFDDLAMTLDLNRQALKKFRESKAYKNLKEAFGYVGLIRALEVTHGFANGWHPHLHELWFFEKPLSVRRKEVLQKTIFRLWHKACATVGLGLPNRQHGVKVTATQSPEEYLSKLGKDQQWGAGSELTQLARKQGKKGSRTPFDLLRSSAAGDKHAGKLFQEYAFAFFGARQLFWSHGLKNRFNIDDLSDQELAEQEDEKAKVSYAIENATWAHIMRLKIDLRGTLLSVCENAMGDGAAVHQFILRI